MKIIIAVISILTRTRTVYFYRLYRYTNLQKSNISNIISVLIWLAKVYIVALIQLCNLDCKVDFKGNKEKKLSLPANLFILSFLQSLVSELIYMFMKFWARLGFQRWNVTVNEWLTDINRMSFRSLIFCILFV